MAMTLRLPDPLVDEAQAFAASLGISMNALVAVALRDYLDGRHTLRSGGPSAAPSPAPGAGTVPTGSSRPGPTFKAPASRSDPCPCGALDGRGYPMKWKHCHGKA